MTEDAENDGFTHRQFFLLEREAEVKSAEDEC